MKTRKMMMGLLGAALIAFGSFGLVGCSEAVAPADDMPMALATATIPALDVEEAVVNDATIDMPMQLERPAGDRKRQNFGGLLKALNLTAEQQTAVKDLLAQHEDCAKAVRDALRASEQALMEPFKAQRDEVKAKLAAGEITREEARALIGEINAAAREALKNNPEREAAKAAMQACRDSFLAALRALLTPEQSAILDQWIADPSAFGPGKGDRHGDKGGKGPGKGDRPDHGDKGGKGHDGRGHHDNDSTGTGSGSDTTNTNPNTRG
ncbi:MAG: hypothetical protein FGM24_01650 [Candidatus Kapabacteria bacterium]|nr:hypothetical protein [Candidatus Kapabacteria bacterium]